MTKGVTVELRFGSDCLGCASAISMGMSRVEGEVMLGQGSFVREKVTDEISIGIDISVVRRCGTYERSSRVSRRSLLAW